MLVPALIFWALPVPVTLYFFVLCSMCHQQYDCIHNVLPFKILIFILNTTTCIFHIKLK